MINPNERMIKLKKNSVLKKLVAVLLSVLLLFALGGCKKDDDTNNGENKAPAQKYLTPEEASKYVVTLGKYSGLEIDLTTTENIKALSNALKSYTPAKITDRLVQKGDTVNIEYTGRFESTGEAFEGGSASGASLTIGSGTFIPGFEEGLIGADPKEPIDLHLTFPVDYHSKDLAGKKVVFSVFINYIQGYRDEDLKAAQQTVVMAAASQNALENTKFADELPADFVQAKVDLLIAEIEAAAAENKMDLQGYLTNYFGMTEEDMKKEAQAYAKMEAESEIMYLAIAHNEGLTYTDEEFDTEVQNLLKEYKYENKEDFFKAYGGEEDIRNSLFLMKISDHIGTLNTIKK